MADSSLPPLFEFLKLTCGWTDYLVWDLTESLSPPEDEDLQQAADRVCARRKGVGACGLVAIFRHGDFVRPRLYRPEQPEGDLDVSALLCAAKYLFDGARFARPPWTFTLGPREVRVWPVDSLSLTAELPWPLAAAGDGEPAVQGVNLSQYPFRAHFLDSIPRALFLLPLEGWRSPISRLGRRLLRMSPEGYLPVVMVLSGQNRLELVFRDGALTPDVVSLAAQAGWLGWQKGLVDQSILVLHRGHPYFVEVLPRSRVVRVSTPIRYVMRGQYSFADYPI